MQGKMPNKELSTKFRLCQKLILNWLKNGSDKLLQLILHCYCCCYLIEFNNCVLLSNITNKGGIKHFEKPLGFEIPALV